MAQTTAGSHVSLSWKAQERGEGKMRACDSHPSQSLLTTEPLNHMEYRLLRLKGTWGNQVHIGDNDLRPLMNAEEKENSY